MLHYISLLLKHKRLVLSGPSGTGKTYLAHRLARYLLERSRTDSAEFDHEPGVLGRSAAVTFNMHHQSQKVRRPPRRICPGPSVGGHPGRVRVRVRSVLLFLVPSAITVGGLVQASG